MCSVSCTLGVFNWSAVRTGAGVGKARVFVTEMVVSQTSFASYHVVGFTGCLRVSIGTDAGIDNALSIFQMESRVTAGARDLSVGEAKRLVYYLSVRAGARIF